MQSLRLPPTLEGSIAVAGSAENAVAHITSVIATREHLHLIGLSAFAALEYSMTEGATVDGFIDHLVKIHETSRKALIAFQTAANVSAETVGTA